jgi:hypothetical protein
MEMMNPNPEWEANLDRRICSRTKASLMSNAKWRAVFRLVFEHQVWFSILWVDDELWNRDTLQHPVPEELIRYDGIADPGIGGPVLFKQILWVRFPACRSLDGYQFTQPIDQFQKELESLGQFPLFREHDYLKIRGYE